MTEATPPEAVLTFQPRQWVRTTCELSWPHGTGTVIPSGELIQLATWSVTSNGPRWSGWWDGHYVWPLPPDCLEPVPNVSLSLSEVSDVL